MQILGRMADNYYLLSSFESMPRNIIHDTVDHCHLIPATTATSEVER